jgi:hypothetical protein
MWEKMAALLVFALCFSCSTASMVAPNITSRSLIDNEGCNWPIDLTLERDGQYDHREARKVSGNIGGRSGNTIIQYMVYRLNAASLGGFAYPWAGLVGIEDISSTNVATWGPRFGKLSFCKNNARDAPDTCPSASTSSLALTSNTLVKSVASQKCPSNDAKFHQVIYSV